MLRSGVVRPSILQHSAICSRRFVLGSGWFVLYEISTARIAEARRRGPTTRSFLSTNGLHKNLCIDSTENYKKNRNRNYLSLHWKTDVASLVPSCPPMRTPEYVASFDWSRFLWWDNTMDHSSHKHLTSLTCDEKNNRHRRCRYLRWSPLPSELFTNHYPPGTSIAHVAAGSIPWRREQHHLGLVRFLCFASCPWKVPGHDTVDPLGSLDHGLLQIMSMNHFIS